MPVTGRSDEELVALSKQGGEAGADAFDELVARYRQPVVRLLSHLLKSSADAEDVAQEAFVRAYLALDRTPKDVSFIAWMRVIATRLAFNHHRDSGTRRRKRTEAASETSRSVAPPAFAERDQVLKTLELLSYIHREVLVLKYAEELDVDEIASVLDIGTSAVKMRLKRAREAFRDETEETTPPPT